MTEWLESQTEQLEKIQQAVGQNQEEAQYLKQYLQETRHEIMAALEVAKQQETEDVAAAYRDVEKLTACGCGSKKQLKNSPF